MRFAKHYLSISCILILFACGLSANEEIVSGKITPEIIKVGQPGQIEVTYNIPTGYYQSRQQEYFCIETDEFDGIIFEPTIYPEGEKKDDGHIIYYGSVTLIKKFIINKNIKIEKIKVYAGYQLCDSKGLCHFPEEVVLLLPVTIAHTIKKENITKTNKKISTELTTSDNRFNEVKKLLDDFTIGGISGGYQNKENFIIFLDKAVQSGGIAQNTFAGKNIWLVILLILLGGIVLNLTPCVLPMIPITIAVLGAGTQAESKGRGFLIGGIYGLGMTLSYGTLGLLVVLTGSKFGAINSSPWFNIIIAIVFIVLALAMFDVISFDFSRFRAGNLQGKSNKGKFITIFIMGVIAAILAGACVAPVLISVILYSTTLYAKGNPAGLLLPFLLGIGMAIPWPFAGSGLSFLPKPGKWMKWIKYIFGVIIFIIAIYYAYTGIKIFQHNSVKITSQIETPDETSTLPWIYSLPDGLKKAKLEGKPVMIDFWATWCKNCFVMDATTFKDEEVTKKIEDFVIIKYKAENLKESPTKEILEYFKIIGLPSYAVLIRK